MSTSEAKPASRYRIRRLLLLLLLVALLGGLGYWLYPSASDRMLTLDGRQHWTIDDAPPRRQIIWQSAEPAPSPELPPVAQESILRPQLTADRQTLYLTLRNEQHDLDIFQSQLVDDHWMPPVRIDALTSAGDDIGPTFNAEGDTLYFYSDREGGQGGFDLYQSQQTASGWGPPTSLGPKVNTLADEIDPFLAPDGKSLYFSSNHSANMSNDDTASRMTRTPDRWTSTLRAAVGLNQYNLFRSRRADATTPWDTAKPLTTLNRSDANDGAPYIDPSGAFLYFASDRPRGEGEARNFDIYRARVRQVGHGTPENLGQGINTQQHELEPALSQRGFAIYFSRSDEDSAATGAPSYRLYHSKAIEVEVLDGRDYSRLSSVAAAFRRVVFGLLNLFKAHWWWLCLLFLAAALIASLIWYLKKLSFQRASVPVFFVWAMAIHLILGAGSFYVYFDSELLQSVKKTFRSMLVASKLPSDELHQSHKPGQEAYEKVADLKSVETVQTSDLARQITENPNVAVASDSAIPQLPTRTAVTLESLPRVQVQAIVQQPVQPQSEIDRQADVKESIAEKAVAIDAIKNIDAEVAQLVRPRTQTSLNRRTPAQPTLPQESVAPLTPTQIAAAALTPESPPTEKTTASADTPPVPLKRQETQPEEQAAPLTVASLDLPVAVPPIAEKTKIKSPSLIIDRTDNTLVTSPLEPLPNAPQSKSMVRANASRELARQLDEAPGPETVISQANLETPLQLAKASPPATARVTTRTLAKLIANPNQEPPQAFVLSQPTKTVQLTRQSTTAPLLPAKLAAAAPAATPAAPQPVKQTAELDTTQANLPPTRETLDPLTKAEEDTAPAPAASIETLKLAVASEASTLKELARIAPPTIAVPRAGALPIPLPAGDSPMVGGPVRPSNTRVVIGSVAREALNAPLTRSPVATALLRTPARAPSVLYAEDNIGLQAMLRLRNVDREAKIQLIEQFGGSEETLETVNRSLQWIVSQQHEDGHWAFNKLRAIDGKASTQAGGTNAEAAATAFGLLPLLGNGNTHQKGPYKDHVQRGVQWLLKTQQGSGEFKRPGTTNARMYSHGVAAIALCEAYAMSGDAALKVPAQKAIDFIVKAQHKTLGGWRYQPGDSPDTSVVGWQVMAIKSAQMANLAVPAETLDGIRTWLDHVAGQGPKLGQFGYTSRGTLKATMSAEALLCHQYLDMPRHDPTLEAGARYLRTVLPQPKKESSYYWYYGTQVMFHLQGDDWKTWNQAMKPLLLNTQVKEGHEAGSWPPEDQWDNPGGRLLATSLRVLILEVYFRHLPLYKFDE